jgi:feruloyl-CoA synthase
MTTPRFRPLEFGVTRVHLRDGVPGTHYLMAEQPLVGYPERITDRLRHWAQVAPDRTLFARRVKDADGQLGDWRHVSFGEAWGTARNIAQALIQRGLNVDRPVSRS